MIYKCSSIEAEKKRRQIEEKCLLDYMLIVVYRYLTYMFELKNILYKKFDYLASFIQEPNNVEKRKHAFSTIAILQNMDIELAKYDFTIKAQPSIVDDIVHFQNLYQYIITGVENINNTSSRCVPISIPQEVVIETAKELISEGRSLFALTVNSFYNNFIKNKFTEKTHNLIKKHIKIIRQNSSFIFCISNVRHLKCK